jgi:AAA domain-containing protein
VNGDAFRLDVATASAFVARPEPPESALLLGPLVRRCERVVLLGDTGHGKTTLSYQMGGAVIAGEEALGYRGEGIGPLLILDLEQGERSIKRLLREARLDGRDDVLVVSVPDGLALDADDAHYAELGRVVAEHQPSVVLLDPYYKAHRADDPNAERPIVDLMRRLDGLRAEHGFALVMPAHPRKNTPGRSGSPRKLTLADVAGSGAVTRGAEVVLAIERLSHGHARLRILKDRDGDLEVGDEWPLIFDRDHGFRLNPKEEVAEETIEARIRADVADGALRTVKEWAAELSIREKRARDALERLAAARELSIVVGPPGRSPRARCYGTAPTAWAQSGVVDPDLVESATAPTAPTFSREKWEREQYDDHSQLGPVEPDQDEIERLAELARTCLENPE